MLLPWIPWVSNDDVGWTLAVGVAPLLAVVALVFSIVGLVRGSQRKLLPVLGMCLSLAALAVWGVLVWRGIEFIRSG